MTTRWDDFFKLIRVLSFDLLDTYDRLRYEADHQPSRRNWVRTLCSQIEAFAYSTKQILGDLAELPFVKLTPHEVLLLREEAYELTDNGEPKLRGEKFVPIKTNLKFIAKTAAKAFDLPYTLDTDGTGWRAVDTAFRIRNRLVHPKSFQDMYVTDEELKTVSVASDWFHKTHREVLELIDSGLKGTKPSWTT